MLRTCAISPRAALSLLAEVSDASNTCDATLALATRQLRIEFRCLRIGPELAFFWVLLGDNCHSVMSVNIHLLSQKTRDRQRTIAHSISLSKHSVVAQRKRESLPVGCVARYQPGGSISESHSGEA